MHPDSYRTCRATALLMKPFAERRSRCHRQHGLPNKKCCARSFFKKRKLERWYANHKPADQFRHVTLPVIRLHAYTAVHSALGIIVGENELWQGSVGGFVVHKATEWPHGYITCKGELQMPRIKFKRQENDEQHKTFEHAACFGWWSFSQVLHCKVGFYSWVIYNIVLFEK